VVVRHGGCGGAGRDRGGGRGGCGRDGEDWAGDEGTDGADRQDDRGEDGTPNSHDETFHASTEAAACELVPAATPGAIARTDHRQSSADYRK
jgi:hypothetical protein